MPRRIAKSSFKDGFGVAVAGDVEQFHGRYFTQLVNRVDYRHALPAVIPIAGLGLRKS